MPFVNARWSAITIDCKDPDRLGAFWGHLLARAPSEQESDPGWVRLGEVGGPQPAINFQLVPEPKYGKTRIHLDVSVDDMDEAVANVQRLGGRSLAQRYDYDEGVVMVMADPEGNEFCLVQYFH